MTPMQRLQAKLREETERKKTGASGKSGGDNASYAFWNIPDNSTAILRFLPDGDAANPFFWRNREVIRLPFVGQVGGEYATEQPVSVTVPCVDMFEEKTCPIIAETRPWWNGSEEQKEQARTYYKKRSYLFQGFVCTSPFKEEDAPANPIRRFVINKSIYDIVYKSLMDAEMEDMPTDFQGGRDFKVTKTRKGDYANYGTSSWTFKTRPLTETELVAIDTHKLHNLGDFLGPRPDSDGIAMIKAMFHDSLAGRPFDFAAYGHAYRAYGGGRGGNGQGDSEAISHATPARAQPARPLAESVSAEAPAYTAPAASTSAYAPSGAGDDEAPAKPQAADILERIRAKRLMGGAGQ